MAGIFTLQLMPILVAIPPAMVRSSVMMLVHPAISRERDTGKQKQLREKLMSWLHLHASNRENARSSRIISRSSSSDSMRSSLLSIEKAQLHPPRHGFPSLTYCSGTQHQLSPIQHQRSHLDAVAGRSGFKCNVHFVHILRNVCDYSLHHGPIQLRLGFAFLAGASDVIFDGSAVSGLQRH